MKLTVSHAELARLMRQLHAAGVAWVLCELTGPGWIVSFKLPENVPDLSAYRKA